MDSKETVRQFRAITDSMSVEMFDEINRDFCRHIITNAKLNISVDELFWDTITAYADIGCVLVAKEDYVKWTGETE
jgi:hypothetical protein